MMWRCTLSTPGKEEIGMTRDNVIQLSRFRSRRRSAAPRPAVADGSAEQQAPHRTAEEVRQARPALSARRLMGWPVQILRTIGRVGISAAKHILFLVLLWLRRPIRLMLGIVGVPAMIAVPILWFFAPADMPQKTGLLIATGAFGFVCFWLSWTYDSILARLSPTPLFLG